MFSLVNRPFSLANRPYTGAKTKLLDSIDTSILEVFDYRDKRDLSFFDVFAGTGVVSECFIKKPQFSHCVFNDFLYSNFIIYQGFLAQIPLDSKRLKSLKNIPYFLSCIRKLDYKILLA